MDVISNAAYAKMIFTAADAFQRIVTTEGDDVANLLHACTWLLTMFDKLSMVAFVLVLVQGMAVARVGWEAGGGWVVGVVLMTGAGGALGTAVYVKVEHMCRMGQIQGMWKTAVGVCGRVMGRGNGAGNGSGHGGGGIKQE